MNDRSIDLSLAETHPDVDHDDRPARPMRSMDARLARVRTLSDLHDAFAEREARENEDAVLPLRELTMVDDTVMRIPGVGHFMLTEWAKSQLAARLGIKWDKWFGLLSPEERADEINKRLARSSEPMRVRTAPAGKTDDDLPSGAAGHLRALVAPTYTPIADSLVAGLLLEALGRGGHEVYGLAVTDKSVHYGIRIGDTFRSSDRRVGDLKGGIMVRNSGVGYTKLSAIAHIVRLICTNGMQAPIEDPVLVSCVHRGVNPEKLRLALAEKAGLAGGILAEGSRRLILGRAAPVADRKQAFLSVLERASLPQKHLPALEAAYALEPEESVFGIVQAATRAAQDLPPELRHDLERAAAKYLVVDAPSEAGAAQ